MVTVAFLAPSLVTELSSTSGGMCGECPAHGQGHVLGLQSTESSLSTLQGDGKFTAHFPPCNAQQILI